MIVDEVSGSIEANLQYCAFPGLPTADFGRLQYVQYITYCKCSKLRRKVMQFCLLCISWGANKTSVRSECSAVCSNQQLRMAFEGHLFSLAQSWQTIYA